MGFPSKFDEFIESANLTSHVRPRSASAAIGPNGPESAAMVCAMYARAGNSVKISLHDSAPAASDIANLGSNTPNSIIATAADPPQHISDAFVALKSKQLPHSRSWFDTDSEVSCSSEREDQVFELHNTAAAAQSLDAIVTHSSTTTSPPCSHHCDTRDCNCSTNNSFLSAVGSSADTYFQGAASLQHSELSEGIITSNTLAFSREVFAPNVLPWFKAKRKTGHR